MTHERAYHLALVFKICGHMVGGSSTIDYPNKWSKLYRHFWGSMPPEVKPLSGDAYGSEPEGKVIEFCEDYAKLEGDVLEFP